jgi:hypothetical protein
MGFTQQYFCQILHYKLTTKELPILSELNPRTVRKYLLRAPQDAQVRRRHRALDEGLESELTTMIVQRGKSDDEEVGP